MPRRFGRRLPLWDAWDEDRERVITWERRQREAAERLAANVAEGRAHVAWTQQYHLTRSGWFG